ncbi:hemin-degrading factor [Sediminicoccus rosea]|uniref:ChuX/HutX family heme-like substrate-binding protein n=1 Tax=Sediminicoccus rosea TaxID=1225128 RepID=A0ABZ0PDE0_9PROT|nr:ChuX/HutX family heme-like substrate-binding protein [Sediminicoccus rosea]WPB83301.1 ChuX/HutX family heme-like substrate-binding protein [Sediminicoccus rosea]
MNLSARHAELMYQEPRLRIRDAAQRLGTTEAALVALQGGTTLRPDWPALFAALPALGGIMALTRNEHAVHERHGRFEEVSAGPGHILVTGPDIDLRLFTRRWAHAFAVAGERPSLQIFDVDGEAAHKIFATEHTDRAAWAALVERFTCLAAAAPPQAAPAPATAKAEAEVDGRALRSDWLALRDTHDFFGLLNRHKASRRQAFRLAGEDLALPLAPEAARTTLQLAAAREVPIMVFVGNRNAIQIHTGPVRRLAATPGWFNVLDPAFNLHLREAGVAEAWRVVKPTEDGAVTSIELLDAAGETVAMLFGARKPGQAEREDWRRLASDVAQTHAREEAA